MIDKMTIENGEGLAKLSGRILNYRKKRDSASFVFSKSDQNKMGAVAIAAPLAGLREALIN